LKRLRNYWKRILKIRFLTVPSLKNELMKLGRVRKAISKALAAVIIVVIVVAVVAGVVLLTHRSPTTIPPIAVASTSLTAAAGTPVTFSVYNPVKTAQITFYFGDGASATTNGSSPSVTHVYSIPGHYYVMAEETLNGKVVSNTTNSLISLYITPSVSPSEAPYISVPVISFNTTKSPGAPIVKAGETVYLYGSYLELPSNTNITKYVWNFGNGTTYTVAANSSNDYLPEVNPVAVTYDKPGLYFVTLTVITENISYFGGAPVTYNYSIGQTIAVSGPGMNFAPYTYQGNVTNPGVITVAENVAGGPYSFDPQVDYESVGFEVVSNIFATLLVYNGSSTTSFIPFVATEIPTTSNGGISNDYTTYTFHIRQGLRFSNGDNLTAYDVWYTMIRDMLFVGGTPGTPDWILAQYLIPGATIGVPVVTQSNMNQSFQEIMSAVTYNNATQTVTFHLVKPTPPQLFFTAIADPLGAGIIDAQWLQSIGGGITFTPQGFLNYEQYGNEGHYIAQMQNDPVSSGPYMIQSYVPGQSVTLVPNPYFPGVPGIPKVNDTVVIEWVKDPETAYNLFQSGLADIVTQLPTNFFPLLKQSEAQGQASLYSFPTLSEFFFVFNINISESGLKQFGAQYHIPSDYFANLLVREAFAYAFNYSNYINDIVGNQKYGFDFASPYAGVIIPGLPYYTPPSQLQGVPTFNLTYATELMKESGEYNVSVNFPIIVSSGDTVDYAAANMWAAALHQMDPNIQASATYLPFSTIIADEIPGDNPMPIYYLGWIADYPYPSDFVNAMYLENGTYPAPDGWTVQYLQSLGYNNEAALYNQLNNLIEQADNATNAAQATQLYKQAEQIAIQLYMYVYTQQPNYFWVVKPYMTGYHVQISYEENPMIGGAGDSLYYWWVKG